MRGTPGLRLLRQHLRPHRRALWVLMAWSALEAVPPFLSGLLVAHALDQGFLAGRLGQGFAWLGLLGVLWLASALATRQVYPWLARTVEPLRDSLVTAVVTATLRRAVADEQRGAGRSVSQATEQVEAVRQLLSTLLRNLRQVVASGVAALTGLTVLTPLIAVFAIGFVAVAMVGFVLLQRLLLTRYRRVVLAGERVGDRAAPVINGLRDVLTQTAEPRAADDIGQAVTAQVTALRAYARARLLRLPVIVVGVYLPMLTLLALAPWLLAHGQLTAGDVAGGVLYVAGGLQQGVRFLVNAGSTLLVSLGVVLDRLAEVCAVPAPPADESGREPTHHNIELRAVTFAYSEHAAPIISDLDLEIPAGRHLAVVGPSGVGKSTVANLLTGLVQPQRGELRLGGVPLPDIDLPWFRRHVALIPQDAYVFVGTVRENLRYLRPDVDDAALDSAVDAVGARETVHRLGGYDGWIAAGGQELSPGEQQLLALARVYLSPAEVVLLDEATCHLDPVAEARAEEAFAVRGGTVIVIAHRISSARRADEVLVMDGIAPVLGNHADLVERSDLYSELVGNWHGTAPTS